MHVFAFRQKQGEMEEIRDENKDKWRVVGLRNGLTKKYAEKGEEESVSERSDKTTRLFTGPRKNML